MAFDLINPHDGSVVERYERGQYLDLPASKNVYIPPLCVAVIPHDIKIECYSFPSPVWIARVPGVFMSHNLFVDCGPVKDGEIVTEVFNLSNFRVLVRKGDSISRLVAL